MASLEQLIDAADLRHPCDLDLLLFFDLHPAALMTSEQLAAFVGYDVSQIGKSLDLLVERQLLVRSQKPTHFARLYRFNADHGGEVQEVLRIASTAKGRRQMRQILRERQSPPETPPPSGGDRSAKQENTHA